MKMKRSIIVSIMALAIGLGYNVVTRAADTAGPVVSNGLVSPSVVDAGTPAIVTADISDPSGVDTVRVGVWDKAIGDWKLLSNFISAGGVETYHLNLTVDTTGYADGTYPIVIWTFDTLFAWATFPNNFTTADIGKSINVKDLTGPVVENAALSNDVVPVGTPVIITADISDRSGVDTVRVGVFDKAIGDWKLLSNFISAGGVETYHLNLTVDTTGYADGTYPIVIWTFDTLFAWATFPNNFTTVDIGKSIRVDNPPVVKITHPKDGDFAAASLNVAGNAWDTVDGPLPVEVSINTVVLESDGNGDFGGQIVGPSTGEIVITAKAIDSSGNVGSDSVTILRVHDNRK